jgi:hypothetical protein
MRKQTNTLSPSPKCFQSPSPRTSEKSADSDVIHIIPLSTALQMLYVRKYKTCEMWNKILKTFFDLQLLFFRTGFTIKYDFRIVIDIVLPSLVLTLQTQSTPRKN